MAIAIEGATVVVRIDSATELVEGGVKTLTDIAPNSMALADEHLWRCPFMVDAEAEKFLGRLVQVGLNSTPGPNPDAVIVNEFDLEISPYCEWLKVARIQKAVIAWLDGTTPTSVMAREGWSFEEGSGLQRHSEDDPDLEFLRRENGIEVYFDNKSQKEIYLAIKSPSIDALNASFKRAAQVIRNHWIQPGEKPISGSAVDEVRAAIAELTNGVDADPDHWQSHLMIGKGWQALGDEHAAYTSLNRAFKHSEENESVPRELAGLCLQMGRVDEAVKIGERAASLRPDNHETLGNLACAYLVAGRHAEATKTIEGALKLDSSDVINCRLAAMIFDVTMGRRPQPHTLAELMTNPPNATPAQSLWQRLQFWKR